MVARTPAKPPARRPAAAPAAAQTKPAAAAPARQPAKAAPAKPAVAQPAPDLANVRTYESYSLGQIIEATLGDDGCVFCLPEDIAEMLEAGHVETNPDMMDDEAIATRATDAGIAYFQSLQTKAQPEPAKPSWGSQPGVKPVAAQPAATVSTSAKPAAPARTVGNFKIASDVPLPTSNKRGRSSTAKYPFDELEIGQSFFMADEDFEPNAETGVQSAMRSLAGSVASANKRWSQEIAGEVRTNRAGHEVPATEQVREFKLRSVLDGSKWDRPGVAGAAVFRIL